MSVKRRELLRYLEQHGFYLLREGANHAIYTDGNKIIPVKRHKQFDRITANELCKQAGINPSSKKGSRIVTLLRQSFLFLDDDSRNMSRQYSGQFRQFFQGTRYSICLAGVQA